MQGYRLFLTDEGAVDSEGSMWVPDRVDHDVRACQACGGWIAPGEVHWYLAARYDGVPGEQLVALGYRLHDHCVELH